MVDIGPIKAVQYTMILEQVRTDHTIDGKKSLQNVSFFVYNALAKHII